MQKAVHAPKSTPLKGHEMPSKGSGGSELRTGAGARDFGLAPDGLLSAVVICSGSPRSSLKPFDRSWMLSWTRMAMICTRWTGRVDSAIRHALVEDWPRREAESKVRWRRGRGG